MAKDLTIEAGKCLGCESCVEICPEVFALDEATRKVVACMPIDGLKTRLKEALKACPVGCIHWR